MSAIPVVPCGCCGVVAPCTEHLAMGKRYCEICWDELPIFETHPLPAAGRSGTAAASLERMGWWHDWVRALEEDR